MYLIPAPPVFDIFSTRTEQNRTEQNKKSTNKLAGAKGAYMKVFRGGAIMGLLLRRPLWGVQTLQTKFYNL